MSQITNSHVFITEEEGNRFILYYADCKFEKDRLYIGPYFNV